MFGFGKVACVVCDRPVPRREALAVRDRKGTMVCVACRDKWASQGGTCAACQTPVRAAHDVGVFLDRYTFGHADCGAAQLTH